MMSDRSQTAPATVYPISWSWLIRLDCRLYNEFANCASYWCLALLAPAVVAGAITGSWMLMALGVGIAGGLTASLAVHELIDRKRQKAYAEQIENATGGVWTATAVENFAGRTVEAVENNNLAGRVILPLSETNQKSAKSDPDHRAIGSSERGNGESKSSGRKKNIPIRVLHIFRIHRFAPYGKCLGQSLSRALRALGWAPKRKAIPFRDGRPL